MSASVVLTCLFAVQQLTVGPVPSAVGHQVVLRATALADLAVEPGASADPVQSAAAGTAISLELPDGSSRQIGATDAAGVLRYELEVPGQHAFSANISGVRCVASMPVAPARNRWLLAIVCIPLGLAMLWLQLRRLLAGRKADVAPSQ